MRTGREQMAQYLAMTPDQLRALPDRILRDWLLDCVDSVKFINLVLKYEDYLASRISGDEPPYIGFEKIAEFLGDHADHAGLTPEKRSQFSHLIEAFGDYMIDVNFGLDGGEVCMRISLKDLVAASKSAITKRHEPTTFTGSTLTRSSLMTMTTTMSSAVGPVVSFSSAPIISWKVA